MTLIIALLTFAFVFFILYISPRGKKEVMHNMGTAVFFGVLGFGGGALMILLDSGIISYEDSWYFPFFLTFFLVLTLAKAFTALKKYMWWHLLKN